MPEAHHDPGVIHPPSRKPAVLLSAGGLTLAIFSAAVWIDAAFSDGEQWGEDSSAVGFCLGVGLFVAPIVWGVAAGISRKAAAPTLGQVLAVSACVVILWLVAWMALESGSALVNWIGMIAALACICSLVYWLALSLVWVARKIRKT